MLTSFFRKKKLGYVQRSALFERNCSRAARLMKMNFCVGKWMSNVI